MITKLKTKKAQIGVTLTWFVAFLIIFFVMLLFVGATALLSGKKFLPIIGTGKNEITLVEEGFGGRDIQRRLVSFLNLPINFNDKKITMYNLIDSSGLNDKAAAEIFRENAETIFLGEFPKGKGVIPWWIRVYGIEENMNTIETLKNFHAGAHNCNPNDSEKSLVSSIIIGDKKVVFCVTKSYYFNLK